VLTPAGIEANGQTDGRQIFYVRHNRILQLVDSQNRIDWCFLPFVHPERDRENRFIARVQQQLGPIPTDLSSWLVTIVRDRSKRTTLSECYSVIRLDHNLTSMSLYSGPIRPYNPNSFHVEVTSPGRQRPLYSGPTTACGWLATGDADLKSQRRRAHFLLHYGGVFNNILTFGIPHHGSKNNFDDEILPPYAQFCTIGAATRNSYNHPHNEVTVAIQRAHRKLLHATEKPSSMFTEYITGNI
jgi:hypothetical protein